MKKILFLFFAASTLLFAACGSEDKNETPANTKTGKWEPTTLELIKVITLYNLEYPHSESCPKDYLEFKADNNSIFYRHETGDCKLTEYQNAFVQTGNNVQLNVLGNQISGKIVSQTETSMVIESEVTAYIPIIREQFPDYEKFIPVLEGGTVKLTFVKI